MPLFCRIFCIRLALHKVILSYLLPLFGLTSRYFVVSVLPTFGLICRYFVVSVLPTFGLTCRYFVVSFAYVWPYMLLFCRIFCLCLALHAIILPYLLPPFGLTCSYFVVSVLPPFGLTCSYFAVSFAYVWPYMQLFCRIFCQRLPLYVVIVSYILPPFGRSMQLFCRIFCLRLALHRGYLLF